MDMYNKKEEYEINDVMNEDRYIKKNTFDDSDEYIWIDDKEQDDFEGFDGLDSDNTK